MAALSNDSAILSRASISSNPDIGSMSGLTETGRSPPLKIASSFWFTPLNYMATVGKNAACHNLTIRISDIVDADIPSAPRSAAFLNVR
ncbi:MAG: hypothetical protein WDO68_22760 [Gammaproteobacteria bacterium]